jgi:hypothetical protein
VDLFVNDNEGFSPTSGEIPTLYLYMAGIAALNCARMAKRIGVGPEGMYCRYPNEIGRRRKRSRGESKVV